MLSLCRHRSRAAAAAVQPAAGKPVAVVRPAAEKPVAVVRPAAGKPAALLPQTKNSSLSICRMSALRTLCLLQTKHITLKAARAARTTFMWNLIATAIFCWIFLLVRKGAIFPKLLSGIRRHLSPKIRFLPAIKAFPVIQKSISMFALKGTTIISITYRMTEITIQVLSIWTTGGLPLCAFPLPN